MDKFALEYLKKTKKDFNNDGWWGKSAFELSKDINKKWLKEHNENDDYWNILYGDIVKNPNNFENKTALDFGCGFGGNIKNLSTITNWSKLYGCDIAPSFVEISKDYLNCSNILNFDIFEINGYDLSYLNNESIDFVTSIVVLQHIALYQIRFKILKEFFRILKIDGHLSFQMNMDSGIDYYSEKFDVDIYTRPNCRVLHSNQVIDDLVKIGFNRNLISYTFSSNPLGKNGKWIYVKAYK